MDIRSGGTLVARDGRGKLDCAKGASSTARACINADTHTACTSDADCGGGGAACQPVEACFFGPPVEIPVPPPFNSFTGCVIKTHADVRGPHRQRQCDKSQQC